MRRSFSLILILAVALFVLMWSFGALVAPYSPGGWWRMGSGIMSGPGPWGGYGRGMMYGYGPRGDSEWYAGWHDLNLSVDNVKANMERWLIWQGNPRLKLGDVKEKDADTIVADIVTKDNSPVQRFVVNRHNSHFQPSED